MQARLAFDQTRLPTLNRMQSIVTHYLAELYTPKPAWLALTDTERQQFFAAIGAAMPALSALGVEALALGKVDQTKAHAAPQTFFAVWRCPNDAALEALVDGIAQSGWHDYFETINAGGEATDLAGHLAQLGEATRPQAGQKTVSSDGQR